MTSERIKEIQETTAYPESVSVMLALNQVWNECEQESYSEEDMRNAIDYGANLGLEGNIGNSFEWTRKKDLFFEQFKKKQYGKDTNSKKLY